MKALYIKAGYFLETAGLYAMDVALSHPRKTAGGLFGGGLIIGLVI